MIQHYRYLIILLVDGCLKCALSLGNYIMLEEKDDSKYLLIGGIESRVWITVMWKQYGGETIMTVDEFDT